MKKKFAIVASISLMLSCAVMSAFAADGNLGLLGDQADPVTASRTITIGADTQYVNVTRFEVVKFVVGDKVFAWNFDEPAMMSELDLNKIAPPGTLNHVVKAYIARNMIDDGGH